MDACGYGGGVLKLGKDEKLAEAQARIEALEWLVEVQEYKLLRPRIRPTRKSGIGKGTWKRWSKSNAELRSTLEAARAAAGV